MKILKPLSFLALASIVLFGCKKADTAAPNPTNLELTVTWVKDGTTVVNPKATMYKTFADFVDHKNAAKGPITGDANGVILFTDIEIRDYYIYVTDNTETYNNNTTGYQETGLTKGITNKDKITIQ